MFRSASIIFFIACIVITGCKKSSPHYESYQVLEYRTNTPIAGAKVLLFKCLGGGEGTPCTNSVFDSLITDSNGGFQFASNGVHMIVAEHQNYIYGHSGDDVPLGDVYLSPLAHTKAHLKKVSVHDPALHLDINVSGDQNTVPDVFNNISPLFFKYSFNMPNDTTVILNSYGNNNNTLLWYIGKEVSPGLDSLVEKLGSQQYYINRFDTAVVEIDY
jgi:hypothetical protein